MDIAGLRQNRARAVDALSAITLDANATDEQLTSHASATAEVERLNRVVAQAESAQRARGAAAQAPTGETDDVTTQGSQRGAPVALLPGLGVHDARRAPTGLGGRLASNAGGFRAYASVGVQSEPGIVAAQMVRCLILGKGDPAHAQSVAVSMWGANHPAALEFGAALQANDANGGGFLIPERISADIIDLLWPVTTIRRACMDNGNVIPLVGGTDNLPTVESGPAASYIGEGADISASEPTFGQVKLVEREMAALVPISNKLLRHAAPNVDMMVRNLLVRAMAQTEDLAMLRNTAAGAGPRGLRYQMAAANIIASNATVNLTNIDADARKAELALEEANIPMIDCRWIMAPRTFTYLRDLRNANGVLIWPSLSNEAAPTWKGYKVEMTNNVPKNLGGGSDESEVYLVDFGFVIIADSYNLRIDASDVAAYVQGSTLVSAFSKNQTVIRALTGHDMALTRAQAAACLTGVKWN
jgi:HK97 family phage major capsid protein